VAKRNSYAPFGETYAPTVIDGTGYTGHVMDQATGLTYMQQRYYDPQVGRFLSIDPANSTFNSYAYANNSSYRFTDPDGRSNCADPACKTSTVDSVLPRSNSQPPPVNGTEGLSRSMAQKVDAGYATMVTFQNDNPNGASPNQPLATKTANAVEGVISKAGVQSVNINSTTGGLHGSNSNHAKGRAVDINRVDGKKVNATNAGATRVQTAARQAGDIRENFGPAIMEKTTVPGDAATAITDQALIDDHADHIHLSGQP
jgi:RHS repeat-associated protein